MIQVKTYEQNHRLKRITISGHAGYSTAGNDIVCAAVSSIVTTSVNAMVRMQPSCIQYKEKEGFVSIELLDQTKEIELLVDNMLDLLGQLEIQYNSYIKINKEVSSC
ncbi:MAG: ribosomal-processing cysteine protease Prp [Bacilli bacterium]|nr:ribosomal-processing cysteine protease Prp [Bacilli bacterium]